MHSRNRSAWPQCRAYSSIRCTSNSRTEIPLSPSRSPRSECSANSSSRAACSSRSEEYAAATTSSSASAPSKSASGRAVDRRQRITISNPVTPPAFRFGEMAKQTQERHRRRRDRTSGQLLRGQFLTLHQQGHPVARQIVLERGQLAVRTHAVTIARVVSGVGPHIGIDTCPAPSRRLIAHAFHCGPSRLGRAIHEFTQQLDTIQT